MSQQLSSNLVIIQRMYQDFANRNMEGIKSIFAKDVEWKQMEGFPGGGTYVGFDSIVENVFKGFRADWTDWKAVVTELLDAGESILAIGYYQGTFNKTGKSMKADFIHRYILQNEKVVEFVQYTDTRLVARAMNI